MPLSDGTNTLLKAGVNNDMDMINILLSANLAANFIDTSGFMYKLASMYQSREKGAHHSTATPNDRNKISPKNTMTCCSFSDVNMILQEVQARIRAIEEEQMAEERRRAAEEQQRNQILPRPEPVPRVRHQLRHQPRRLLTDCRGLHVCSLLFAATATASTCATCSRCRTSSPARPRTAR